MLQVLKTDWSQIADGTATGIEVHKGKLFPVKDGYCWTNGEWYRDNNSEQNTIIAVRPRPPLTDEQKQAIRDYYDWLSDPSGDEHPETYFKALEDE